MATLQLDSTLLQQAQHQAEERHIDIVNMIENVLREFINSTKTKTQTKRKEIEVPEYIKNFGVKTNLPKDYDYKKEYHKHLEEKYG